MSILLQFVLFIAWYYFQMCYFVINCNLSLINPYSSNDACLFNGIHSTWLSFSTIGEVTYM